VLSFGYFSLHKQRTSDWHVGPPPTVLIEKYKEKNPNPNFKVTL